MGPPEEHLEIISHPTPTVEINIREQNYTGKTLFTKVQNMGCDTLTVDGGGGGSME